MAATEQRFFFALPRLILWWRGRNANRSEKNGLETHLVGALLHLVVYAFAFRICLTNRPAWQQLLWAIPLMFLVWTFWLSFVYANALVLRLLRRFGWMRDLPQGRAQGILITSVATIFALRLSAGGGWAAVLGIIWIVAVVLNLVAAGILALSR